MNPGKLHFRLLGVSLIALVLILISFGLAPHGYAQQTDAPDPVESSKPDDHKYSLTGTVVNSVTGEAIRRAAVLISGNGDGATLTDSSGHFEFDGLAERRVFVAVTKPGFFSEQGTPDGRFTLQVSSDASPVVLKMLPAGVIVGRVTTRDGDPLEGLVVSVSAKHNLAGRQISFDLTNQAQTDENGDFRVANLPAATYYVAVDQSQEATLSQPGIPNPREHGYAKVFYPGVSELSAAAALEFRPGHELRANFTLTAEPIYQVSGVINGQEQPSGLIFMRQAGESVDFMQNAPTQDRKFQTKLPAGAYVVRGFSTTGVSLSTAGPSVVINSDSSAIHVALVPATSIPIAVRTESSGGGTDASGGNGIAGMSLQLVPNTSSLTQSGRWWAPPATEIQNVDPGVYKVEINTFGPWWVKSVQCGNLDLLHDDLTVAAGVQPSSIEVTLRDDAATVGGTVAQSSQREQATILLVQQHGTRNLVKAVTTSNGRFQFAGVAPGNYALLAFDNVDQLEYANPDVLNPYLSAAAHISLEPRGTASVNLTLSPVSR